VPDELTRLGKDAQDNNDGGSNPWSIEQGAESTLLFFNHDTAPQIFNVLIASADGTQWNKDFKLASMETMAISIADIIQKQMKDDKGKMLPKTAVSGQISWWTVETASGPGTGRLLQSNRASGEARSFACGCPYRLCGVTLTQDFLSVVDGFSAVPLDSLSSTICMYQTGSNCGFKSTMQTSSQALQYRWSSSNSAILQINGSSTNSSVNGYGASVGTATMTGTASANYLGPPGTCTFQGGGPTPVVPKVTFSVAPSTIVGGTALTVANVTSGNSMPISLSISNPSVASLVSPTSTFTTSTNVVVKGLAAGTATLTATVPNPEGGQAITVGSITFSVAVLSIVFQSSSGSTLPSPSRLGVSSTVKDCSGNPVSRDKTQTIQAVVAPVSETPNIGITQTSVSGGGTLTFNITQTNDATGTITMTVVGTTQSANQGDVKIVATDSTGGPQFSQSVSVIVPSQIAIPHPQPSQTVPGINTKWDACSLPAKV
jgi:hypothetical protein